MGNEKPMRRWTLGEIYDLCQEHCTDCDVNCPLHTQNGCKLNGHPWRWTLDSTIESAESGDPFLAKLLGVKVGEWFRVRDAEGGWDADAIFHIDAYGKFVCGKDPGSSIALCCAIRNPGCVVRVPRLTELERAICNAAGATWLCRVDADYQPVYICNGVVKLDKSGLPLPNDDNILLTVWEAPRFSSIRPGEYIRLDDEMAIGAQHDAEKTEPQTMEKLVFPFTEHPNTKDNGKDVD